VYSAITSATDHTVCIAHQPAAAATSMHQTNTGTGQIRRTISGRHSPATMAPATAAGSEDVVLKA
jgi:hypothetical protein